MHLYSAVFPEKNKELVYEDWSFFSLEELIQRADHYNHRFYDVGVAYGGMGNIHILSYCPKTKMFFFHSDGGPRPKERTNNHAQYLELSYDPAAFPLMDANTASTSQHNKLIPYKKLESVLSSFYGITRTC